MKSILTALIITLSLFSLPCFAGGNWQTYILQLHYSPSSRSWGDTDEEWINNQHYESHYDRFDLRLDHAVAGRLILGNTYLRLSQHESEQDHPGHASVDSVAIGIALVGTGINPDANDYFVGNIGLGSSKFHFHGSDTQDSEFFGEIGAEYGFRLTSNILAGAGFNYKHYGNPGETKANWLDFYLSGSVAF